MGPPAPEQSAYAQQGYYGESSGYYGAQSAAAPVPTGPTADYGQQLVPGFPTPYAPGPGAEPPQPPSSYGQPVSAQPMGYGEHPQGTSQSQQPVQPQTKFPNDPYGGYDAVQYPSIPALVEHASRSSGAAGYDTGGDYGYSGNGNAGSGYSNVSSSSASAPAEEPGAPNGNVRYKVMLLPTRDGGDIENVVIQVGLDGLKFFQMEWQGGVEISGRQYPLEKVSKWRLSDPTIVLFHVVGEDEGRSLGVSADAATMRTIVDTITTSAFQWCELKGYDPSSTIKEGTVEGEWVNARADDKGGGNQSSSNNATPSVPQTAWHETPAHCGWLTKKGEHLSTWRRRWVVLKDGKLGWFKSNDVRVGVKPRGVIDVQGVVQSACTATTAEAGRKFGVELIGSSAAEKAGCKFLVADSERECDAWEAALDAVINRTTSTAGGTAGGTQSASTNNPPPTGLANQLRDGFQRAAGDGRPAQILRNSYPNTVEVTMTGYTSGAQPNNGGGSSYGQFPSQFSQLPGQQPQPSSWETFFTNEGVPYFVNNATGVTQWEQPAGVRVDM